MPGLHPPKIETFNTSSGTNIDPKGVVREVAEYRVEPFGLYLARPTPGRTQFHYLESWLLPDLGLRITDFWFTPDHERDQDFYLDLVSVHRDGDLWVAKDLYLDIVLREKAGLEVIDSDELLTAATTKLLTAAETLGALETAFTTVDGLASHGYQLNTWLATKDITLTWRRH